MFRTTRALHKLVGAAILFAVVMQLQSSGALQLQPPGSKNKLLDMTYDFSNETIYWPPNEVAGIKFHLNILTRGTKTFNKVKVNLEENTYDAAEHGGTHIDAPAHFIPNAKHIDDIPLSQIMGPAVKIDITAKVERARSESIDYLMTKDDVLMWEKAHGAIENGSLVFVYTGYGRFWPDRLAYAGFDGVNTTDLHFPGITEAAAKLLVSRGVKAVGIDSVSPDNMQTLPLIHLALLGNDVIIIENVANLDKLPTRGANVYGLPMKIKHGSGAPVRLFAQMPTTHSEIN